MRPVNGERVPFVYPDDPTNTIEYGVVQFWHAGRACFAVEQTHRCCYVSPLQIAHAKKRLASESTMRSVMNRLERYTSTGM